MSEILHPSQLSTTFIEVSEIDDPASTSTPSSIGRVSSIRHENSNDVRLQEHILKQLNPVSVQLSSGNCNLMTLNSVVYKVQVRVYGNLSGRIWAFPRLDPTIDECKIVTDLRCKITEDTLGMYGAASIYFEFDCTRAITVNYDKIGSTIVINLDKYQPAQIKPQSSFGKLPYVSWLQRKCNWIEDNLSGGVSIVGLTLMITGVCMLAKTHK